MSKKQIWSGKRYHSLDFELKQQYGEKLYKLALQGNMTCPNRDGTLDTRGCIFCSKGGSGDFASSALLSVTKQIEQAKKLVQQKQTGTKYIAYFQSFTNTYAPLPYLYSLFYEAITHKDIAILSIATRPDCLSNEILELLSNLNQIKPVWIELGLQTTKESTAQYIRRGYCYSCFEEAVMKLHKRNITIITHMILGLPFESEQDIIQSIQTIANLPIQGVKLQLLHILKNTDLEKELPFLSILTMEQYISLVITCLERLPQHIIIHRITGDAPKHLLLEPKWSLNKRKVLNQIMKTMKEQDSWQGKFYKEW